jgi:hypothetical protein
MHAEVKTTADGQTIEVSIGRRSCRGAESFAHTICIREGGDGWEVRDKAGERTCLGSYATLDIAAHSAQWELLKRSTFLDRRHVILDPVAAGCLKVSVAALGAEVFWALTPPMSSPDLARFGAALCATIVLSCYLAARSRRRATKKLPLTKASSLKAFYK